ncbi:MAG: hypothetical protein GY757_23845, partial [bacterium]|nr:hypothetical protein [bacterium]
RRFFCLDVSDRRKGDKPYFAAIHEELNNGGVAALLYELLEETSLDGWHPRGNMPASNQDGEDMKVAGLSAPLKFIHHVLEVTSAPTQYEPSSSTIYDQWPETISKHEIYELFLGWCDTMKIMHRANIIHFARDVTHAIGVENFRPAGNKPRVWKLPPLKHARELFKARIARVDFDE